MEKSLIKYIEDSDYLASVGSFDPKYGDYEFESEGIRKIEADRFTQQEIKELYLFRFDPVDCFELDKTAEDFIPLALESLINWYCT